MAEPDDPVLHKKIEELNQQMDHLATILDIMADKMTRIEQATSAMHKDMQNDMKEIREELELDNDEDWKT